MDASIQPAPVYTQTMCHIISSIGQLTLYQHQQGPLELQNYGTGVAIHGVLSSKSANGIFDLRNRGLENPRLWVQCGHGLHGQQSKYLVA